MCGIDLRARGRHDRVMGDVINLRRARKQRARADKAATATENRARFGRSKAEKAAEAAEQARLKALVDGAKLE